MAEQSRGRPSAPLGAARSGVTDLIHLAWPSVLSFVCNSAYRINDQFWVKDLGPEAHAALSPCTFLLILNFAFFFLAVGGSMTLVARSTGAANRTERDDVIRHTLVLAVIIGIVVGALGFSQTSRLVAALGVRGDTAELAQSYLGTVYLLTIPLALAPVVETTFIAMGNTRVPLMLQGIAVSCNFILNPILIYGWGSFEGLGMAGAALATGLSRGLSSALGLFFLVRRFQVRLWPLAGFSLDRLLSVVRIGLPSSLSILVYTGVYFALLRTILSPLGTGVLGGLSIGFNAFEGVAFPFFLGIAVAGSSLVGRNLGAGEQGLAVQAVRSMRILALITGALFTLIFLFLGPVIVPLFTKDPAVAREALLYVRIIAASQIFVALEAVHEKVLLGAGHTPPIFLISVPGNLLRLPLAWLLAGRMGLGAAGVWWAVNLTTLLKSFVFAWIVHRGSWRRVRPGASPNGKGSD